MPEADVTYSDVKFTKSKAKANGTASPSEDTTYSEVKIAKTPQPTAELTGPQQPAESKGRSCLISATVVVLLVLLVCVAAALGYTTYQNIQTTERLQKLQVENEALKKNITERKCEAKPCVILNQLCPNNTCLKCEDGWERFGAKCYHFSTSKFPWTASRENCRRRGGANLVKIDSEEEQIFLDETLRKKMDKQEDKFWIGLTDSKNEGEWLWVDGSPLNQSLEFWSTGEPDNWGGENTLGEDCGRMGEKGGAVDHRSWFDRSCENPHKYICEKLAKTGKSVCKTSPGL